MTGNREVMPSDWFRETRIGSGNVGFLEADLSIPIRRATYLWDCGRLTQHLAMKDRPDIWSDNPSDVLFGQHFGCAFVQLFGASHFFEAGEQIIGPQAPFLGALKVVDNLATVHHD
jgi:hypothetical protein